MKDAVSIMPDIDSEGAELAATVNANLAYLYMRAQNTETIKQHLIATAATMDKYDLVGADKAWVQAVSAAVCADGEDEFERRLDVLLEIDRLFYKKKDDFTLKRRGIMNAYAMSDEQITAYGTSLRMEERCEATVQKYVGAVRTLFDFLPPEKTVTRELLLAWKVGFNANGANVVAVHYFCAFVL